MQRRRRRFPGIRVDHLVLFLCSGMLYARAADVFFEKEEPSQAAEASGDLAALPGSADPEGISGDEDMRTDAGKAGLKAARSRRRKKRRATAKRPRAKSRSGRNPGKEKSDARPSGKEKPVVAVAEKSQPQPSASKADTPSDALSRLRKGSG